MSGYIYILQEREVTATREPIYKIIRRTRMFRPPQYPKDSEMIFMTRVENVRDTKNKLLIKFRETFASCTLNECECFSGDPTLMGRIVMENIM